MKGRTVGALVVLLALVGCSSEPVTEGAEPQIRRLSEAQYRNIVGDVFGRGIVIAGRFDPVERIDGLLAVGAGKATITPAGLERYEALARSIARQVVSPENRTVLFPCRPTSSTKGDEACAGSFFTGAGRLLFRRPLTDREHALYTRMATDAGDQLEDFYEGVAFGLAGMLVSPKFLFITETFEEDPDNPGAFRLDAYSKAARLSFLLWNTTPDAVLLDAAEAGLLDDRSGLEAQFQRMLRSHRTKQGVRAFFADMLEFERFETLEKDPVIYPAFSLQLAEDAAEQTLLTLTHLLLEDEVDYRHIFTSRRTFLSGQLGLIYRVPVADPSGWVPHEFSEREPWAGIHTHLSFQALFSHPGKSSPTLRGKAVREQLLCQKVPDPPGDVDFSDFNSDSHPVNRTARQRLNAHNEEASCAGCHKIMDPIGLAMEQYDGAGQFRTTENGATIDTSGDLDGIAFTDAVSLGAALHANPAATECVAGRLFAYGAGRSPRSSEREWLSYLHEGFAADNYRFTELLRRIVLSDAFYRIAPNQERSVDASATLERTGGASS